VHLSDWMARNGLTDEAVATAISRSRVSVSRYRRRLMRPDWETIQAIREYTGGKVRAEDWTLENVNGG
jgi:transcriptional regulator with XRE-family HTH domain